MDNAQGGAGAGDGASENAHNVTQSHEMSHNVTRLTAKQLQAARWLAGGNESKDIARWLKIRRETVSRWKRLPKFQAAYDQIIEAKKKAAEEDKRALIKTREEMRTNLTHQITNLVDTAVFRLEVELNGNHSKMSGQECCKLRLNREKTHY